MFAGGMAGFELAIIAIFVVFVALLLIGIGQTLSNLYADRKSDETGKVEEKAALRGTSTRVKDSSGADPTVGEVEERSTGPQKSYDFDSDDFNPNRPD